MSRGLGFRSVAAVAIGMLIGAPFATNQWNAGADRDPAIDTYASPDVWANFVDFYQRASTASKLAQQASNAKRLDEFKELIGQLRAACNSCHEKYMKTN